MNNAINIQNLSIDPVSAAIGFAAGAAVFGFLWALSAQKRAALAARLESERDAMGNHFHRLAQEALQSNNEHFLTIAGERLKAAQERGASDLDKRTVEIEKLVKPIEKELLRINTIAEQMQGTDKAIREDLMSLKHETSKLTGVLRNPSAQGKWGEFVLEAILERANLIKGIHYSTQEQIEGGRRPDVIINLHDGFRIAIDSKAPINEYIARLDDDISEDEAKTIQSNMARAVRAHVKSLGAKTYQDNIDGSDFVILFLPSEVVFSATLRSDPDIVDYAAENHVVIASPTLIISLLRVVGLSWRQVEMAKNAAEISALGAQLQARFSTFLTHFSKIGKNLNSALTSYNDAVGSAERSVLPAARKFTKLHAINQANKLPDIATIDNAPRQMLAANEAHDILEDDDDTDEADKISHG
jgi:DNA recombination protein RmuC